MFSAKNKEWASVLEPVNPDLLSERATLNFDQEQLAELIWGSKEAVERHRRLSEFLNNDPILKNTHHYYDMTREEKIEYAYAKTARMVTTLPEQVTYKNIMYLTMLT